MVYAERVQCKHMVACFSATGFQLLRAVFVAYFIWLLFAYFLSAHSYIWGQSFVSFFSLFRHVRLPSFVVKLKETFSPVQRTNNKGID